MSDCGRCGKPGADVPDPCCGAPDCPVPLDAKSHLECLPRRLQELELEMREESE